MLLLDIIARAAADWRHRNARLARDPRVAGVAVVLFARNGGVAVELAHVPAPCEFCGAGIARVTHGPCVDGCDGIHHACGVCRP